MFLSGRTAIHSVQTCFCVLLSKFSSWKWMFFLRVGVTSVRRLSGRLKLSHSVTIWQYVNGLLSEFLDEILGVDSLLFLYNNYTLLFPTIFTVFIMASKHLKCNLFFILCICILSSYFLLTFFFIHIPEGKKCIWFLNAKVSK